MDGAVPVSLWEHLGHFSTIITILTAPTAIVAVAGFYLDWWRRLASAGKLIGWSLVTIAMIAYCVDLSDRFGFLGSDWDGDGPACIKSTALDSAFEQRANIFLKEAAKQLDAVGKPIGCRKIISNSSRGDFDRATEIWISNPPEMKFLFRDPVNWESYPEPGMCGQPWCEHGNVTQNRAHFEKLLRQNIPLNRFPPFGGTALFLNGFPEFFKRIGWQIWQCERAAPTFFQVFEKGTLYGPYQSQLQDKRAEIFALLNDKTWTAFRADAELSVCGPGSF